MQKIDLDVASITLEPIAAINAAIPENLRLLNLVMVDIGAGTSDIAVCTGGSVIGYTMATVAGDEITEMLMKDYLVDFHRSFPAPHGLPPGLTTGKSSPRRGNHWNTATYPPPVSPPA